jgi:hypothetical protein
VRNAVAKLLGWKEIQVDQRLPQAGLEQPKSRQAPERLEVDALTQVLARRRTPLPATAPTKGCSACGFERGFGVEERLDLPRRLRQSQKLVLKPRAE